MSSPPPQGYTALCPYIVVAEAEAVRDFAVAVFAAEEVERPVRRPDGRLAHVTLRIGDSTFMLGTPPDAGFAPQRAFLHAYVADADATHAAALAAGAEAQMPVSLQNHGDRAGMVKGPGDILWWIATRVERIAPEEVERRMNAG